MFVCISPFPLSVTSTSPPPLSPTALSPFTPLLSPSLFPSPSLSSPIPHTQSHSRICLTIYYFACLCLPVSNCLSCRRWWRWIIDVTKRLLRRAREHSVWVQIRMFAWSLTTPTILATGTWSTRCRGCGERCVLPPWTSTQPQWPASSSASLAVCHTGQTSTATDRYLIFIIFHCFYVALFSALEQTHRILL